MLRRFFLLVYMMRVPLITLLILGVTLPIAFRTTMFHGVADIEESQVLGRRSSHFCWSAKRLRAPSGAVIRRRACGWLAGGPAPEQRVSRLERGRALCGRRFVTLFPELVRSRMRLADPQAVISLVHFIRLAAEGLVSGTLVGLLVFFLVLRSPEPEDDGAVEVFALPAFLIFRKSKWIDRKIRAAKNRPDKHSCVGNELCVSSRLREQFPCAHSGTGYGIRKPILNLPHYIPDIVSHFY